MLRGPRPGPPREPPGPRGRRPLPARARGPRPPNRLRGGGDRPAPPGPPRAEGAAGTAPPCSGPFGAVQSRPARGAPSCSGRGGSRQRASCKCLLCLLFFKRGSQGGLWLWPSDSAAAPRRPFYSLKSRFLKSER